MSEQGFDFFTKPVFYDGDLDGLEEGAWRNRFAPDILDDELDLALRDSNRDNPSDWSGPPIADEQGER